MNRIAWEPLPSSKGSESGSVGSMPMFVIYSGYGDADAAKVRMRVSLPGLKKKVYEADSVMELKDMAEEVLTHWVSKIGATFLT